MVPPADRHDPTAASILDFKPRLGNRCKVFPVYTIFRASILDFKPRLANRCKVSPVYTLLRALILDFKPRLGNRCSGEWFRLLQPSLPPQRSASDSNLRSGKEEWFRLQRAWRTQAGTGCHEGGIILSKKPPEWHLFLPQQRSASDSNFVATKKNGFACCGCCGNREWFLRLRV